MRYLALALDYDGTTAIDGKLSEAAAAAIERLRTWIGRHPRARGPSRIPAGQHRHD